MTTFNDLQRSEIIAVWEGRDGRDNDQVILSTDKGMYIIRASDGYGCGLLSIQKIEEFPEDFKLKN